ncbi:hypothetical protein DFH09DRAFT_1444923 [Mycena vulgaris]|nr:hypothetical protein DFH09DRAFT_1444923 [Mycena vulgaris]
MLLRIGIPPTNLLDAAVRRVKITPAGLRAFRITSMRNPNASARPQFFGPLSNRASTHQDHYFKSACSAAQRNRRATLHYHSIFAAPATFPTRLKPSLLIGALRVVSPSSASVARRAAHQFLLDYSIFGGPATAATRIWPPRCFVNMRVSFPRTPSTRRASDLYLHTLPPRERLDAPAKAPIFKCWISRSREQALRHAINAPPTFKFWISRSREVAFAFPAHVNFRFGLPASAVTAPSTRRAVAAAAQQTNRTTFQLKNPFSALPASNLILGASPSQLAARPLRTTSLSRPLCLTPPATTSPSRALSSSSNLLLPLQVAVLVRPAHSRDRSTLGSQLKQRPRRDVCNNRGAKPQSLENQAVSMPRESRALSPAAPLTSMPHIRTRPRIRGRGACAASQVASHAASTNAHRAATMAAGASLGRRAAAGGCTRLRRRSRVFQARVGLSGARGAVCFRVSMARVGAGSCGVAIVVVVAAFEKRWETTEREVRGAGGETVNEERRCAGPRHRGVVHIDIAGLVRPFLSSPMHDVPAHAPSPQPGFRAIPHAHFLRPIPFIVRCPVVPLVLRRQPSSHCSHIPVPTRPSQRAKFPQCARAALSSEREEQSNPSQ